MARGDFLAFAIIVAVMVLAVTCDEEKPKKPVSKCWVCSSNAKDSDFCGDPFDVSKVTEAQKKVAYIDCPVPPNRPNTALNTQSNQYVVCRKLKKFQNDTIVIDRNCFWQELNNTKECKNENLPNYIKVESCSFCNDTDGCNHSPRTSLLLGQIVTLMALPLAIATMLSF